MKENEPVGKAVYKAIAAVQGDMAAQFWNLTNPS